MDLELHPDVYAPPRSRFDTANSFVGMILIVNGVVPPKSARQLETAHLNLQNVH
jgi:hypothetical protein